MLAEQARRHGVEVWAYCLMPNHVHLILTPCDTQGMGLAVGEAHRRYTNFVNARGRWSGHLFQNRFASVVMDETHLLAAARYVALNPVRARLVGRPGDWPWSSAPAHLAGRDDRLVTVAPLLERVDDFAGFLDSPEDGAAATALRAAETTGRPLGSADFIVGLEQRLGRKLAQGRPGPAPKPGAEAGDLWG
jgi:putative transposase